MINNKLSKGDYMKKYKSQFMRITDVFVGLTVIITAATLVASGLAVTRINTEYMETGVRAVKLVAERENEEIFFSLNEKKFSAPEKLGQGLEKAVYLLPAPLNTVVYFIDKINELI